MTDHWLTNALGTIIAANTNAPGSWHDSRVARPIYDLLLNKSPPGFYLVADTAFPRGVQSIEGRIRAPMKAGNKLRGTHEEIENAMLFDRQLLSYRQTAEWGNRGLQGSFGRLQVPLETGHEARRGDLLEICIRAFNLRSRRVGINQIRAVYFVCWESEWGRWDDFESVLFSEQRRNDRVARFHTVAVLE
jgi:DDE superfamily endonuclease